MDEGVERERTGPPAGRIKPPPLLTSRIRERGLEIALADFISGQIILRGSVLPFVPSPAPPLAPASPLPPAAFDVINATLDVDADGGGSAGGSDSGSRVEMTSRGYLRDVGLIRSSTHRKRVEIVNPFRAERIKGGYYF